MKKLFKNAVAFMFIALLGLGIFPSPALAQGPQAWTGVCIYQESEDAPKVATIQGLQCLLANVLSVAITLIGIVAFFIFIISAFQIMMSGSNSKGLESAKGSITFAIVGIVVALSAFLILNLLSSFTGINLTRFVIPAASDNLIPAENN